MDEFKKLLFSEQPEFDETKASVMMDCYFMTLITGLNDELPNAESMLRQLSNKIALL
jgi:hypothetical protein